MGRPQLRQRARSRIQERRGMLSYQAIGLPQRGQRLPGETMLCRLGTRAITTLRKLPTTAPVAKTQMVTNTGMPRARSCIFSAPFRTLGRRRLAAGAGDEQLLQRPPMRSERHDRRARGHRGGQRRPSAALVAEGEQGCAVALQHARAVLLQARHQIGRDVLHHELHRARLRRHQIRERAAVRQPSLHQDADAVADRLDVGEDVRGKEDGAALVPELEDQIAHVLASDGVEAAHRLVQDRDPRVADQRLRESQPLHHALGEFPDGPIRAARQTDAFEHLRRPLAGIRARQSTEAAGEHQILVSAQELVERGVFRQVPELTPGGDGSHALACDEGVARCRLHESEQHLQRGGLARAVRPEKAEDLARAHFERQILHRTHPAGKEADPIGLAQSLRADLRLHPAPLAALASAGNFSREWRTAGKVAAIVITRDRLLRLAPALLGLALLAIFFAPTLDPRVQLYYRDTGRLYYPVKLFIAEQLPAGRLPFWDPWTECGVSLLGQVTPALLHPATLLYLVFPFELAFKLNHML